MRNSELIEIERKIFLVRGHKVMLSPHLAELYDVETRTLVQAVKRNIERFPEDFMFPLDDKEYAILKSQIVISSWGGVRRANPYAFTEQGVAMLSSVLNSKRAVQVNIQIMRTFIRIRQYLSTHEELAKKFRELEKKVDRRFGKQDRAIQSIIETINYLLQPPEKRIKVKGFIKK